MVCLLSGALLQPQTAYPPGCPEKAPRGRAEDILDGMT